MAELKTKIKVVPIDEIRPNDENPRYIKDKEFDELLKSIQEFPEMLEARPIAVDENGMILGGNMRYRACRQLGLTEIPVAFMHGLTDKQKREFIIKDNVQKGDWDWDILANLWDAEELVDWGLQVDFSDGSSGDDDASKPDDRTQWNIVVNLEDETSCAELYDRLTKDGYTAKIVQ